MMVDYSIVIPAYNEEKYLPGTLAALKLSMDTISESRGEIIVVNNNSTDNTGLIAKDMGARVIFEEYRQIARARNAGARKATGRYLIFVDADTKISQSLLQKTLITLGGGACCGGGAIVKFDKPLPFFGKAALALWTFISKTMKWASGSYLFCTRNAFCETKGFNERYYAAEEIHFSRALKKWGKKQKQNFIILKESLITSSRKVEWYSGRELFLIYIKMLFYIKPFQNRNACKKMWYSRPDKN